MLEHESQQSSAGGDAPSINEIRRLAEHVWEDRARAEMFLTSPHAMLGGKSPEEASASPDGARQVREILLRLEYSIPA